MEPLSLSVIVGLVATVGLTLARLLIKSKQWESIFRAGVPIAFNIVNDIAARTDNKIDDKVALGLGALNDWLRANGQSEMKPVDVEKAKLLFSALHGEEKAAAGAP